MKRMLALVAAGILALSSVGTVAAAPITCPPGHEVVKTDAGWQCVNHGDSGNPNTEETKNPND